MECKSQKKAVGPSDINSNRIEALLKAKAAHGYLLVCKNDATASLKRIFSDCNGQGSAKYIIWNGSQLWHKLIKRMDLLKAFFPNYYRENYLSNSSEDIYQKLVKEFEEKLKGENDR